MVLLIIALYFKNHKGHNTKYLVFSSVGDKNNVQTWISEPGKKNFDLVIYYYGEKEKPAFDAELIVKRKGLKLDNFYHFLNQQDIEKYESIWLVDDDIIMNTSSINRMFQIFSEYKLWLAQPSYDKGSLAPHIATRNDPSCILRYTNFVEVGAPIFSTEIISKLKDSFTNSGTGFGLDYIWPSLLGYPTDKIAVIDEITCQHPDTGYSALDEIMPRSLHKLQGAELLIKYGLLQNDWRPTDLNPWPKPYQLKEYSRVSNI